METPIPKQEALIKEAKRRGFKKGVIAIHLTDGSKKEIVSDNYDYYHNTDSLYVSKGDGNGVRIYHKGEWSEVVSILVDSLIPDRWQVHTNIKEEQDILKEFIHREYGWVPHENENYTYFCKSGFYVKNPNNEEISFSQFKKYILNKNKNNLSLIKKSRKNGRRETFEIQRQNNEVSRGQRKTGTYLAIGRPRETIRGRYHSNIPKV